MCPCETISNGSRSWTETDLTDYVNVTVMRLVAGSTYAIAPQLFVSLGEAGYGIPAGTHLGGTLGLRTHDGYGVRLVAVTVRGW